MIRWWKYVSSFEVVFIIWSLNSLLLPVTTRVSQRPHFFHSPNTATDKVNPPIRGNCCCLRIHLHLWNYAILINSILTPIESINQSSLNDNGWVELKIRWSTRTLWKMFTCSRESEEEETAHCHTPFLVFLDL